MGLFNFCDTNRVIDRLSGPSYDLLICEKIAQDITIPGNGFVWLRV